MRVMIWSDMEGVIRLSNEQRAPIDVRKDRYRFDAHLAARSDDANGDLATISNQDAFEHRRPALRNGSK